MKLIPVVMVTTLFLCGTTVRKTTMPGGHTCCPLQHNHGLKHSVKKQKCLKRCNK